MWDKNGQDKYPYYFLLLYAVTYMASSVYSTFIPVYLDSIGFSRALVGALLALGPFVAIIAHLVWGVVCDRAANKNSVLKILLLGSAVVVALYPLSDNFFYLFAVIVVFTFFQSSISPINDAMTLEYLESSRWRYGPIRMAGTLGFAFMAVVAGVIAKHNINNIFIIYFCISVVAFLSVFRLPLIKGHQSGGSKVPLWRLFKSREMVLLIVFNFVIQATFGFYYSFFSIYYKQLGADSALLGLVTFIASLSEIPFLMFADKIVNKLGVKFTLIASASVISVRWMLLHFIIDKYAILVVNATHGLTFIVFAFCLVTYISRHAPRELRASGQTMNALLGMGLARIAGSVLGGAFSDMVGIKQVFLYISLIDFAAVAIFGFIFLIQRQNRVGGDEALNSHARIT